MNSPTILPFPPDSPEHCAAARRFNDRLAAGGFGEFHFSESATSRAFPKAPDRATWMEYFLAVENGPEVRGGYILRYQPWWSRGEQVPLVFLKLPVSEGVIDPAYASLGIELLQHAAQREPSLYALGMGGVKNKLPRILQRLGWDVRSVPFFFRVLRPSRVLRQVKPMRSTLARRVACDVAAFTGMGWPAFAILQRRLEKRVDLQDVSVTLEPNFGTWCDPIWEQSHACYDWVAQRDSSTLPILHPDSDPRFLRMHVRRGSESLGWVLGLNTPMKGHKQFGDLRVASFVDAMARPEHADVVTAAATRHLESLGPDLIVSNQLHHQWGEALTHAGYLSGPSNFALALAPEAARALAERGCQAQAMMLNRGDGDGPINL